MLIIDERDQEQLDQKELEEEANGEEAKIVIISLVRNNMANDPTASGKIGFLKSPNCTNVLLS
ncbi:hypothetical protein BGZ74_005574 [Mortierella antarctica]|nr:hypothetical protein BGZ74_005574 [Mortierella antarctica]